MIILDISVFVNAGSESQVVVHKDHMDPSGVSGKARYQELTADRVRRLAVHAGTCLRAGRIEPESLRVDRSSYISCPLHGSVYIITDLIHSNYENNLLRSLSYGRYTI